eukprot:1030409-Pelagomonas_calceolata.AAC.3
MHIYKLSTKFSNPRFFQASRLVLRTKSLRLRTPTSLQPLPPGRSHIQTPPQSIAGLPIISWQQASSLPSCMLEHL